MYTDCRGEGNKRNGQVLLWCNIHHDLRGENKDGSLKLGRHQTAKGYEGDLQKYDAAMQMGWTVYRCSPAMVKSGQAIKTIERLWRLLNNEHAEKRRKADEMARIGQEVGLD